MTLSKVRSLNQGSKQPDVYGYICCIHNGIPLEVGKHVMSVVHIITSRTQKCNLSTRLHSLSEAVSLSSHCLHNRFKCVHIRVKNGTCISIYF
jgi:hypothetical protein